MKSYTEVQQPEALTSKSLAKMPQPKVSSVIGCILNAFANAMEVFDRTLKPRSRKRSKNPELNVEETRLQQSLVKGPQSIRAKYEHGAALYGGGFKTGDPQSHSSLAQTLLVMNTGLIEILNHVLTQDKQARSVSRISLLNLSEVAATDTLNALNQLTERLTPPLQMSQPVHPKNHEVRAARKSRTTERTVKDKASPSPLLERGGWVRTNSGSMVVSAAKAKKRAVRKQDLQLGHGSETVAPQEVSLAPVTSQVRHNQTQHQPRGIHAQTSSSKVDERGLNSISNNTTNKRPPSLLVVPADYFDTSSIDICPPRPPKIPFHTRPDPTMRARPISAATFMTASTKIGEIPEGRWPDRILTIEEEQHIPMPYVIPPPLVEPAVKKKRFRLWKRQPSVPVYV